MTFQIFCKSCGSKLIAKEELIGQTRKCPKCQSPVLIEREESIETELPKNTTVSTQEEILVRPTGPELGDARESMENVPERLEYRNRYLVLNPERIVALWESGKGWQINVGNGFSSAKKNIAAIPDQGTFALVELVVAPPEEGTHPKSLHIFKVSVRGALTSLYRDESEILRKIDCRTELSKPQKFAMLSYLNRNFMYESLSEATDVIQQLSEPEP